MPWCSHHPTCTSAMVYSTELRRRVVQSVGVTAAVSACCMMHLGDVEVTDSALSALWVRALRSGCVWPCWWCVIAHL